MWVEVDGGVCRVKIKMNFSLELCALKLYFHSAVWFRVFFFCFVFEGGLTFFYFFLNELIKLDQEV